MSERFFATYDIESPVGAQRAAEVMAGEQSTGTFVRLAAETEALRERSGARVERLEVTGAGGAPALPCRIAGKKYERARITISWPLDNIGPSLPNLLATVAGNLFELAELSAIRLTGLDLPVGFGTALPGPRHGIAGSRHLMGVGQGPMIGTIIKPSIGLTAEETADLVRVLVDAGIDFIKDDELQSDGPGNRLAERARQAMAAIDDAAQASGRKAMYAFNVTGEFDEMARRCDMLERLGATCAMVSLFSVGLPGLRFLRERTPLAIHGHRNGWGLLSRSPHIGIAFPVMQQLWRLAGADHLHVNGLANKFTEEDAVVIEAARSVQAPLKGGDHLALPVFSSGQTAWQVGPTIRALGNADFLFCAGGGIMSHPSGPAAGIIALRQAAEGAASGIGVRDHARSHPELAAALAAFRDPAL